MNEPWLSLSIGAALLLLIVLAFGTLLGLKRRSTIALYLVIISLVAAILVKQHNDFGLFKVAMFAQAFLWFAIVAVFTRIRWIAGSVAYVIVLSTIVITDLKYTRISLQDIVGGGNLISGASRTHLLTRVLVNQAQENCDVNYDTANPPLIKVLGATRGCAKSFIARPKLFGSNAGGALAMVETNPLHQILGIAKFTARAAAEQFICQLNPGVVRQSDSQCDGFAQRLDPEMFPVVVTAAGQVFHERQRKLDGGEHGLPGFLNGTGRLGWIS